MGQHYAGQPNIICPAPDGSLPELKDRYAYVEMSAAAQATFDAGGYQTLPVSRKFTDIGKPTNDHVCPGCKNDKVSKAEQAKGIPCWKCGGKL